MSTLTCTTKVRGHLVPIVYRTHERVCNCCGEWTADETGLCEDCKDQSASPELPDPPRWVNP